MVAIGFERLLSAYLIGSEAPTWSLRVLIAAGCSVGAVLAALLHLVVSREHGGS